MFQEHERKRGENFGDPLDFDNQITPVPAGNEQKNENSTSYGTIVNGEPKPASPEGKNNSYSIRHAVGYCRSIWF